MSHWLYVQSERNPDLFTVGFYKPDGKWEPESDHRTPQEAADRVHFLNGGRQREASGTQADKLARMAGGGGE